jgi:DHA2 family multidrug resistance protein-like MFS transporter
MPVRATPRDWLGLAVLALPCILYSMDLTLSAEPGGALGIAILGSLMTAVYRHQIDAAIANGLPAEAESARDTLGAAAAVAADQAGQAGATLLEAARLVFTDAVILTSSVSACLAIVAAAVVGTALRNVR